MPKCEYCGRIITITKDGTMRAHTTSKDCLVPCMGSGEPAPDWYVNYQAKKIAKEKEEHEYLRGAHWKEISTEAKRIAGNRCQLCNSKGKLHTHHRTYERVGHELQRDLIVLCADCHKLFHDNRKADGQL